MREREREGERSLELLETFQVILMYEERPEGLLCGPWQQRFPRICRWVLLHSLSVSMGNALKNHIVFSSFRGCVAEKVSNSKAASFMIYVTFDASLISNTNTSCFSTVQNHLQPKRKCGAGVGKGHKPGELRACGPVDRGKYFVISRVQLVQIQNWFCFTPRTRIWLRFQ